jgi:uncharacterized protein (DUF952 family)
VVVYHIAHEEDWAAARATGEYRVSTRGRTLDEQGFIHASDVHQVAEVANFVYAADDGLVVLEIDEVWLRSPVRYERPPDSDELFPHIYGPLDVDAVAAVWPLPRGRDGRFRFPPGLERGMTG